MKKLLVFGIAFILVLNAFGQSPEVQIVFDITSPDEGVHQSAIRHVNMMSEAYPKSEFELVLYSSSINMALKNKSSVSAALIDLLKRENVSMVVCEMTLKRHEIAKEDLIEGIGTVPDGILEIIQKQKEGWGYIKESK